MTSDTPESAPIVTIGFFARELFSRSPTALRQIIENTADVNYRLLIIDSLTPPRYIQELETIAKGRPNIEILRVGHHLMPNESRKLVTEHVTTPYVCYIENDCFVAPGWLSSMLETIQRTKAGVAVPLLYEKGHYHGDQMLGFYNKREVKGGVRLEFAPLGGKHEEQSAIFVENVESHVLLFDTDVVKKVDVFDDQLTSHDFLDISLTLKNERVPIVFDSRAHVEVVYPPPVHRDEREFYRMRWDLDADKVSSDRVRQKWQVDEIVSARRFARDRLHRETWLQITLYTLQVRVWRRLLRLFRQHVLRHSLNDRLEYARGPYASRTE